MGLVKNVALITMDPFGVEGLVPPEICKLTPMGQCLCETPGRMKEAPRDLKTPSSADSAHKGRAKSKDLC